MRCSPETRLVRADLSEAKRFFAGLSKAPALPASVDLFERRGAKRAMRELFGLARANGEIHPLDVEVTAKQLPKGTARIFREMYEAVSALKHEGVLERVDNADRITPELIARLEKGDLSPKIAEHLRKIAGLEVYSLFADPVRDAELHVLIEDHLRDHHRVTQRKLDEAEVKPDLTLREDNERKGLALLALLTDRKLPPKLELAFVERLGRCADQSAIPKLEQLIAGEPSPKTELASAARAAIHSINRAAKMTIVFASMEVKPYCGTGGLSNVMSELPRALAKMGHRVIVISPRHAMIDPAKLTKTDKGGLVLGDGAEPFRLYKDRKDGVDFWFVDNEKYFSKDREGIYGDKNGDYADNAQRYDFFGASVPAAIRAILGTKNPDVVQLNDAHTSSAAVYLKRDPSFEKTKTVLAVHNLGGAYQGKFNAWNMRNMRFDKLGLFNPGGPAEFYGDINFLKLGLTNADASITVSRQYMHEILSEDKGEGLHGVLRWLFARDRLWGNLNGIDNSVWNPETDAHLRHHYSFADQTGKKACKSDLQAMFGLPVKSDTPVIGVVARLTEQKGFDDIVAAMKRAIEEKQNVQFIVCGDGDPRIANVIKELRALDPERIGFDGKFSVDKEHAIYAGSDFFLMPSKFEPCGLPQMYALRYLTVPIVRAVGGLEESIDDFDPATKRGNGFKFDQDLGSAIDRALGWYGQGEAARQGLLRNCALSDFSWERTSAPEQLAFYRKVLDA